MWLPLEEHLLDNPSLPEKQYVTFGKKPEASQSLWQTIYPPKLWSSVGPTMRFISSSTSIFYLCNLLLISGLQVYDPR